MALPVAKSRKMGRGQEQAAEPWWKACLAGSVPSLGQRDPSSLCQRQKGSSDQTGFHFSSGIASYLSPEIPELSLHHKYKQVQIWGEPRWSIKLTRKTLTFLGPTMPSPLTPTTTRLQGTTEEHGIQPHMHSVSDGRHQCKGTLRQEDAAG